MSMKGKRFRPLGAPVKPHAPVYGPTGTGCPALVYAVDTLYENQDEDAFWGMISTLNYAIEMETRVLVPVKVAPGVHSAPAPWCEHPIPEALSDGLELFSLQREDGHCWLPLFTSSKTASADRTTASMPMVERNMESLMRQVLATDGLDGVVIDPWGHSATLEKRLLSGLLNAMHTPENPGDDELEAADEALLANDTTKAAHCCRRAAENGNPTGLALYGKCLCEGFGVCKNPSEGMRMLKTAAEHGEPHALITLGDYAALKHDNAKALLYYRRAQLTARAAPDIDYTPMICLRMAQYETRYTSTKKALALAAEAQQGFAIRQKQGYPDSAALLAEAQHLTQQLLQPAKVHTNSLQLD